MKKLKRKVKAMTLVEIIVALAVFAMLSLVLAMMGNAVEKQTKAANNLNSRVAVEGPIAEAQNDKASYTVDGSFSIKVAQGSSMPNSGFNEVKGTLCYVSPELGTNPTDASGNPVIDPDVNGDDALKFVAITMPTVSTTK